MTIRKIGISSELSHNQGVPIERTLIIVDDGGGEAQAVHEERLHLLQCGNVVAFERKRRHRRQTQRNEWRQLRLLHLSLRAERLQFEEN